MPLLKDLSLRGLTIANWGDSKQVNWLASETAAVTRSAQIAKPFIYVDLSKGPPCRRSFVGTCLFAFVLLSGWVPFWCNRTPLEPEEDMPSREVSVLVQAINGGRKPPVTRLSLDHWTIAFDIYAVASAAVGSWSYAAARNHKVFLFVLSLSFHRLASSASCAGYLPAHGPARCRRGRRLLHGSTLRRGRQKGLPAEVPGWRRQLRHRS